MYELIPIGVVHSPWQSRDDAPKQGPEKGAHSTLVIEPEYIEGLDGLKAGRRVWVFCWFHKGDRARLVVHPRGDHSRPLTGVFNSRSPHRPNPISLTLVDILEIDGNRILVRGLEAVEGTPVVDIKPYVPGLDRPKEAS